ncbi:MAG TPA: ester cyclase [Streptosporangiaceae bacterium]|nr:ester cyclase [Streptosporangiaceae bacterium]
MHVRMNMLAGDPGLIDEATRYLETTVRPTVESQRGNRGLAVLANAELGTCVVASYWESPDAMAASEQAVQVPRKEITELVKGTVTVEHFEVPIFARRSRPAPGAGVRLIRVDADPARLDAAIEEFRRTAVPELMERPGLCSAQLLADRGTGRCMVVLAFGDVEALAASRASGAELRARIAAAAHVTVRSVEEYSLAFSTVREGDNRSVIERDIELWNTRDRDGWLATMDLHRMELEAPGGLRLIGRDAADALWTTWHQAFPDNRIETVAIHADDRGGVQEGRFIGTHSGTLHGPAGEIPATGRPFDGRFCGVYEFDQGRIVGFHLYFDQVDVMTQLGLMPRLPGGTGSGRGARLRDERDLADGVAGGQHPVSLGHVGERERPRHDDPQLPRTGQPGQVQAGRVADPGPGIRAGPAAEHLDAFLLTAREPGDGRDACPVGHHRQRGVHGLIGPDQVEGGVHPAGRRGAYPFGEARAVRHGHRAELAQQVVPGRAGRGHHGGTAAGGKLDRHQADAPGGTVDQHRVARADVGRGQGVPRRRAGEHQAGGLGPVDRGRLGHERGGGDRQAGRVGAAGPVGDHLVAGLDRPGRPGRAGPHRGDHARGLGAEPDRKLGRIGAEHPAVDLVVDRVDAGGPHLDPRLARPRRHGGLVDQPEDLWATVGGGDHDW